MAGTVTVSEEVHETIKKIIWAWTSDANGDAGTASEGITTNAFSGEILRLVTVPSAVAAPTASYDVYVYDEDTTDVLMGAGVDRHTSNTEQVLASSLGVVANDKLDLVVDNAGDAKSGTVYLYLR
jgi:hypothetical protein